MSKHEKRERDERRMVGRPWGKRLIGIVAVAALALGLGVSAAEAQVAGKMYWADQNSANIQRANLDGSAVEELVTGLQAPAAIALDVGAGHIYWADVATDVIQRADLLDGSNVVTLIDLSTVQLNGIALDLSVGKMYWTEAANGKIQRANLDGSGIEDVLMFLFDPRGIALELAAGKVYWTDGVLGNIRRANLDGSGIEALVTGVPGSWDIKLDVGAGKMYWTDIDQSIISRANLDGANVEQLVDGFSQGIALDLDAGKMYWTGGTSGHNIQQANLDGSDIVELVSGLLNPKGIAVIPPFCQSDADCDDGSACTIDTCEPGGRCVHEPPNCDDGDPCTIDSCDPATGECVHEDVVCPEGEVCVDGECGPVPTGGCCLPSGACAVTTEDDCAAQGGGYQGDGTVCGAGGPPEPSDCCVDHGTPGCDCPDCEATVCAADAFCCDVGWDGLCAGLAADLCGDLCSGGQCGGGGGEPIPQGACCAGGACVVTSQTCCEFANDGEYFGDDSTCDDGGVVCVVPAKLDIKPGSCPNPFNRNSNGVLPVGLLGTGDLDATQVDLSSVQLSRADGVGGSVAPLEGPPGPNSVIDDVGTPFDGELCSCHDLGGDGVDDLSMKFRTSDVVQALELDGFGAGSLVELVLTGALNDGTPFNASDCIMIVPPGSGQINATMQSNVFDTFIEMTPLDLNVDSDGFADFTRTFVEGTTITLTAPSTSGGRRFLRWMVDSQMQGFGIRAIEVTISTDTTLKAFYQRPGRVAPDLPTEGEGDME